MNEFIQRAQAAAWTIALCAAMGCFTTPVMAQFKVQIDAIEVAAPAAEAPAAEDATPKANDEALLKISRQLLKGADVQADKTPLAKFAADIAKQYEIPVRVDEQALIDAGVRRPPDITFSIKHGTLGQALTKALKEHGLRWELKETEVVITAGGKGRAKVAKEEAPQADGVIFFAAPAAPAEAIVVEGEAPEAKVDPVAQAEALQKISRKLLKPADIQADKATLAKFFEDLSKQYDIPIRVDARAIAARVDPQIKITANIKKGTLGQALTAMLKERGMRWELRDTEVVITAGAKDPPPERKVVAVAAPVPIQQGEQFVPQLRVLWKGELLFIRRICEATDEQVAKLQEGSAPLLVAASKAMLAKQQGQQMILGNAVVMQNNASIEPRVVLQTTIKPLLEANLTAAQMERYRAEVEQVRLAKRKMVVRNLVAKLDQDLQLSHEQRDKLTQSLLDGWQDSWNLCPQALMNLEYYFPTLPDKLVVTHLTERQQTLWRDIPKQNAQGFFGGFGLMGNELDENAWDEPAEGPGAGPAQGPVQAPAQEVVE